MSQYPSPTSLQSGGFDGGIRRRQSNPVRLTGLTESLNVPGASVAPPSVNQNYGEAMQTIAAVGQGFAAYQQFKDRQEYRTQQEADRAEYDRNKAKQFLIGEGAQAFRNDYADIQQQILDGKIVPNEGETHADVARRVIGERYAGRHEDFKEGAYRGVDTLSGFMLQKGQKDAMEATKALAGQAEQAMLTAATPEEFRAAYDATAQLKMTELERKDYFGRKAMDNAIDIAKMDPVAGQARFDMAVELMGTDLKDVVDDRRNKLVSAIDFAKRTGEDGFMENVYKMDRVGASRERLMDVLDKGVNSGAISEQTYARAKDNLDREYAARMKLEASARNKVTIDKMTLDYSNLLARSAMASGLPNLTGFMPDRDEKIVLENGEQFDFKRDDIARNATAIAFNTFETEELAKAGGDMAIAGPNIENRQINFLDKNPWAHSDQLESTWAGILSQVPVDATEKDIPASAIGAIERFERYQLASPDVVKSHVSDPHTLDVLRRVSEVKQTPGMTTAKAMIAVTNRYRELGEESAQRNLSRNLPPELLRETAKTTLGDEMFAVSGSDAMGEIEKRARNIMFLTGKSPEESIKSAAADYLADTLPIGGYRIPKDRLKGRANYDLNNLNSAVVNAFVAKNPEFAEQRDMLTFVPDRDGAVWRIRYGVNGHVVNDSPALFEGEVDMLNSGMAAHKLAQAEIETGRTMAIEKGIRGGTLGRGQAYNPLVTPILDFIQRRAAYNDDKKYWMPTQKQAKALNAETDSTRVNEILLDWKKPAPPPGPGSPRVYRGRGE